MHVPPILDTPLDPIWTPSGPLLEPLLDLLLDPLPDPHLDPLFTQKMSFSEIDKTLTVTPSLGPSYRPSICSRELHDNVGCPQVGKRFVSVAMCLVRGSFLHGRKRMFFG